MPLRKPVTPPKPRITRPLVQPTPQRNPITSEIMQRVRRVIRDRQITIPLVADEAEVSRHQLAEWVSHKGGAPYGDNLVKLIRWLALYDKTFVREVVQSSKVRFRGSVDSLRTNRLDADDVAFIRAQPKGPGVAKSLAETYAVHPTMIDKIWKRQRYWDDDCEDQEG
jgi:hypothetical protein